MQGKKTTEHQCTHTPDSTGRSTMSDPAPTWSRAGEIWTVVGFPAHLRRTIATALLIGTILFCINQLNVVLDGHATDVVWLKSGLTYLVPFVVSNVGILIATRRPD